MKKKSIAVLGLGKFGISLVKTLDKYGVVINGVNSTRI